MTDLSWAPPATQWTLGQAQVEPVLNAEAQPTKVVSTAKVISVHSLLSGAGRSVIAANLAFELAATGARVCLIDLDTQWPSQHRYFGLPQDQASVIAGVRFLQQERLTKEAFQELRIRLISKGANVDLVSGFGLNLNAASLDWSSAEVFIEFIALAYSHVVIDLPAGWDLPAHRLASKVTSTRLHVVQPDPISISRFLESQVGRQASGSVQAHGQELLVINRLRASVLGARPEWQVRQTLKDRIVMPILGVLPEDSALDQAMLQGVPLRQLGGKSKFRGALNELAGRLS
jgi:MinD-like ATPase involved in chromosome partitioning or flagellar assembly